MNEIESEIWALPRFLEQFVQTKKRTNQHFILWQKETSSSFKKKKPHLLVSSSSPRLDPSPPPTFAPPPHPTGDLLCSSPTGDLPPPICSPPPSPATLSSPLSFSSLEGCSRSRSTSHGNHRHRALLLPHPRPPAASNLLAHETVALRSSLPAPETLVLGHGDRAQDPSPPLRPRQGKGAGAGTQQTRCAGAHAGAARRTRGSSKANTKQQQARSGGARLRLARTRTSTPMCCCPHEQEHDDHAKQLSAFSDGAMHPSVRCQTRHRRWGLLSSSVPTWPPLRSGRRRPTDLKSPARPSPISNCSSHLQHGRLCTMKRLLRTGKCSRNIHLHDRRGH